MSVEQTQKKKRRIDLVLSKRMITFEIASRSSWTSQANEFESSRSKILKYICFFALLFVTLHPMMSHKTAGGSAPGVL